MKRNKKIKIDRDKVILLSLVAVVFVILAYAMALTKKNSAISLERTLSTNITDQAKQKCASFEDRVCTDSDGGPDYYVKGTVTTRVQGETGTRDKETDKCNGSNLIEYYCDEQKFMASVEYACPAGCDAARGKCNKQQDTNPL